MNIIIADLYVEEKDMDRPWNSLQKKSGTDSQKCKEEKHSAGRCRKSKNTDRIKIKERKNHSA